MSEFRGSSATLFEPIGQVIRLSAASQLSAESTSRDAVKRLKDILSQFPIVNACLVTIILFSYAILPYNEYFPWFISLLQLMGSIVGIIAFLKRSNLLIMGYLCMICNVCGYTVFIVLHRSLFGQTSSTLHGSMLVLLVFGIIDGAKLLFEYHNDYANLSTNDDDNEDDSV